MTIKYIHTCGCVVYKLQNNIISIAQSHSIIVRPYVIMDGRMSQHTVGSCQPTYCNMSVSNLCCSICFECFDCSSTSAFIDDHFCVTTCGHFFHKRCINRWFLQQSNAVNCCPMCRQFVAMDGVKKVYPQFINSTNRTEIERLKMENIQLTRQLTVVSEQFWALNKLRTVKVLRNLNKNLNAVESNIDIVSASMCEIETRISNAESILLETESTLKLSKIS